MMWCTDPTPDKAHPAKMTVVHIPTHGLLINGVVYQASGAGLHPTIAICHGLPGNEKNLDLAQGGTALAHRAGKRIAGVYSPTHRTPMLM